jgi:hypothetical protein
MAPSHWAHSGVPVLRNPAGGARRTGALPLKGYRRSNFPFWFLLIILTMHKTHNNPTPWQPNQ